MTPALPHGALGWTALVAVSISALWWIASLTATLLTCLRVPRVSDLRAPSPASWPKVSVIVPARNEAARLEAAMRSKLANRYPNVEFVLVDDRSTDGTAEIVDRLAAEDPRIRAVHVTTLPEGWLGKVHAMEMGRRGATGEWILLSDADVHLSPDALSRIVAWCEHQQVDFFACLARIWSGGPAIDAITAAMMRVMVVMGRLWKVQDPKSSASMGVGAFNLVRRSALDRTKGLEWLKMETADDVALGQMMKQSGARCAGVLGGDDVGLFWLHDFAEAARSSEKAADMFRFQLAPVVVFAATFLLLDLAPWFGVFARGLPLVQLISASTIALSLTTGLALSVRAGLPLLGAFLQPVGSVLLIGLTARGGIKAWRFKGIEWRGTLYPAHQLLAGKRFKPG